jgi:hypothetical protein
MSKPTRIEILELLSNGKITAAEAADLLSTAASASAAAPAAEKAAAPTPPAASAGETGKEPSWFHVRVANLETGKNHVSVNIPIQMMKFGLKIGKRFSPEIENLDWNELASMVQDMKAGMLVDVQDADSNEHVQVYFD